MIESSQYDCCNVINTCVNITLHSEESKLNVTLKWKEVNITLLKLKLKLHVIYLLLLLKEPD